MMKTEPFQVLYTYCDLVLAWLLNILAEKAFDHLFEIAFKIKEWPPKPEVDKQITNDNDQAQLINPIVPRNLIAF